MYKQEDEIQMLLSRMNFNESSIPHANKKDGEPLENNNITVGEISCYFRNIEDNLIKHISEAEVVVGCVPWFTNIRILEAMKSCQHVSIIVQKEEYLRNPTLPSSLEPPTKPTKIEEYYSNLRKQYESLPKGLNKYFFDTTILSKMCEEPYIEPIRCVGNNNRDKKTFPIAHNKFLVFCKITEIQEQNGKRKVIRPYAFWTGSFNFTNNANKSFENAVYIRNEIVAQQYLKEYSQIAALSEPLNWETPWMNPEWRIREEIKPKIPGLLPEDDWMISTKFSRPYISKNNLKLHSEIQRIYGKETKNNKLENWVFWFQEDKFFVTCIIKKCFGIIDGMVKIQEQGIGPTGEGLQITTFVLEKNIPEKYFDRQLSIEETLII